MAAMSAQKVKKIHKRLERGVALARSRHMSVHAREHQAHLYSYPTISSFGLVKDVDKQKSLV